MTVLTLPAPFKERENKDRYDITHWFLSAVAAGLLWRFVRFGLHFAITGDESGILRSVMERGYAALLAPLSYSNVSPPLFLWMTKLLDSLFQNEWAVRLVPFLAGIGAVGMFGLICRESLRGTARWLAWAVFCVAYVPIVEGTRVKGYTIDLLVATVMLWCMLRWLNQGRKARYLVVLALSAPVFVWFSYTSVFIIAASGFVLIARMMTTLFVPDETTHESKTLARQNVLAGLLFMALASASAISLYVLNVRPGLQASLDNGLADAWNQGYPPAHLLKIPLWLLAVHTGRGFAWPIGDNHYRSALTCALWLTGLVVYWRRGHRWVWMLFVLPQVLSLAAAFLHKYPYLQNPRLCFFLAPGICLFVGQGAQFFLDKLDCRKRLWSYRLAAFALAMCAIGGMARDIVLRVREIKGPGIRSTLAETSQLIGPDGQFVLLNDETVSGVFTYYIKRQIHQKVWADGQFPTQTAPDLRLAVLVVISKLHDPDPNSLFVDFEKRSRKILKVTWSQTAQEVLLDSKDGFTVWVCEPEMAKFGGNY